MTAKEFLRSYGAAADKIKLNKKRMLNAEKTASELGRRSADRAISDYQDRLYSENEELFRLMTEAENAVGKCFCSEAERAVLYKRYILREKWDDIAEEMNYSLQHLHRLERSALGKLKVPAKRQTRSYE